MSRMIDADKLLKHLHNAHEKAESKSAKGQIEAFMELVRYMAVDAPKTSEPDKVYKRLSKNCVYSKCEFYDHDTCNAKGIRPCNDGTKKYKQENCAETDCVWQHEGFCCNPGVRSCGGAV